MNNLKNLNKYRFRNFNQFEPFKLKNIYLIIFCVALFGVLIEVVEGGSNSRSKKGSNNSPRQVLQIYGVNAGGDRHTDVHGFKYEADPLNVGIASDYGMRLFQIGRSHREDEILYRTERYSDSTFGYKFPVFGDGSYVLVLKFCEVYFQHAGYKVFDVRLNSKHVIVPDLDIFAAVGFGNAHQEVIPFKVSDNGKKLIVDENTSVIRNGQIRLDFIKGSYDNPKINAFYVVKGEVSDIPPLPELPHPERNQDEIYEDDEFGGYFDETDTDPDDSGETYEHSPSKRRYKHSGSGTENPWDEVSLVTVLAPMLVTVLIGVAAIGVVFKSLKNV